MGPLVCFRMSVRRASEKVFNPQPNQLDNARRKLSTVTTSTVIPQANPDPTPDIEAQTPLSGFGECPICIGPLVPEPVHTVNADPRPILEKVSTVTSHETNQAKPGPSVQTTTDEAEDDIMTINTQAFSYNVNAA
ncbi:hypothetical protein Forpi1262_v006850 [Fusarium oxysporum f. sp. raphani]|uniref:Uncharacterized protein n=1 Tax=Fusarium oxysporum f. sp. raphani TaxID=96318 RepID=A0A8J5U9Z1_FUSOX|nr:hypothetical protein Forpi1262_v006850 [Fusarium oxysporum f. sp. raphani]